eukprot:m.352653 g.352653  ORF g.352653 m.352653 type:complete len:181 (+) comp20710_c0_seq16:2206-2748(+)
MTVAPIDAFNCTAAEGTDATTAAAGTNDLGTYPPNATPYGIVNLSPVYRKQGGPEPPQPPIASVKRGFAAVQKFQRLLVVDEWDAAGADNVTWSMHFAGAVVNIAADGRTATLARSGATIHATILEPALGTVAGEAIGFSVHGSFFPHFLWFSLFYFLAFSAPFSSAKGSQTYLRCQKET